MSAITLQTMLNKYAYHLEEMRRNHDPALVEELEEKRVILHNQLLDELEALGVQISHRDDAVGAAWQYLTPS